MCPASRVKCSPMAQCRTNWQPAEAARTAPPLERRQAQSPPPWIRCAQEVILHWKWQRALPVRPPEAIGQ